MKLKVQHQEKKETVFEVVTQEEILAALVEAELKHGEERCVQQ